MLRGEARSSSLKDRQAWEIPCYRQERAKPKGWSCKAKPALFSQWLFVFFLFIMKNFVPWIHFGI